MKYYKYMTLLMLCFGFVSVAEENIIKEKELEILGSLYWYSTNCKNTSEETYNLIINRIAHHGIINNIEDNDFIANGMNMAWFAGCDRIMDKIVHSGNSKYLICAEAHTLKDGSYALNCKTKHD